LHAASLNFDHKILLCFRIMHRLIVLLFHLMLERMMEVP
jgi:hypothetical protein